MQYQNVILVLSDGRRLKFTGPAQLTPQETVNVRVVDIEITEPHELPDNCTLVEMHTLEKKNEQSSN